MRYRLLDLELDSRLAEIGRQSEVSRMRALRHAEVNAFAAVEGASMLMLRESLSARDRATLTEVLHTSLGQLRALLVPGPAEDHALLDPLMATLADDPAWRDRIVIDLEPDLFVDGPPSEVCEAIRQLLTHASHRAPTAGLNVRARRDGPNIWLVVDDHGPRISARQRRELRRPDGRIFLRPTAVDSLHLAMRLVRGQGGDVRVRTRTDGGDSFGISWPASVA
jgi:signal transduction histidine kinase